MTNEEKFATSEERVTAFRKFCRRTRNCDKCPTVPDKKEPKSIYGFDLCALRRLELEADNAETKEGGLKPCPFCDGKAKLAYATNGEKRARVSCTKCHAEILIDGRVMTWLSVNEMVDIAISEWNRRPKS